MAVWHLRRVIPRGDAISLRLWQWTSSPTSSSMPLSTMEKGWEKMRIYGKKNYSRNLWQMVWSYVNDRKVNDKTRNENTRQIIKCTKIDKIRIVKSKKKKNLPRTAYFSQSHKGQHSYHHFFIKIYSSNIDAQTNFSLHTMPCSYHLFWGQLEEHQSRVNAIEAGSLLVEFLLQSNKEQECLQAPTASKGASLIPQTRMML